MGSAKRAIGTRAYRFKLHATYACFLGGPTGSATNDFERLLAIHERDPDETRWDPQGGLSERLRLVRKTNEAAP